MIVFDAPSRIRIKHFKGINKTNLNKLEETTSTFSPHFHEYTPSKRLFTERLEEATRQGALAPQGLDHLVRNVTIQLNVNNQREVNADFRESLDYVNVLVKLPKITITQVLGWLKVCEGWRDVKSAVGPSIACYRSLIQDDHLSAHVRPTEADIETAKSRVDPLSRESLLHELEDIGTELKSISDRATLAISIMKNREKEARLSNASRFATWAFTIIPFMILVSVLGACLIVGSPISRFKGITAYGLAGLANWSSILDLDLLLFRLSGASMFHSLLDPQFPRDSSNLQSKALICPSGYSVDPQALWPSIPKMVLKC